jgi:hypothetical protein
MPRTNFNDLSKGSEHSEHIPKIWSWNISVSTANGYRLDNQGVRVGFLVGPRDSSHAHSIQTNSEAHPNSCPVGTGDYHSPPTASDVRNPWIYTFTTSHIFMVQCIIN